MNFYYILKISIKSIKRNKMRSLLTSLGIIIGVCSVIVMIAIGRGSSKQIEANVASMGTNLIMISNNFHRGAGVNQGAGTQNELKMEDVEKIRTRATLISGVSPEIRSRGQVIGGIGNWNTQTVGVDPIFFEIRKYEVENGNIFTEADVKRKSKVCLLGTTVVGQLFPGENPVGQKIRINNTPFTIIGTLKKKGENSWGQDQDDTILAPSNTVLYRLAGGRNISRIYVSAISADKVDDAIKEVTHIMEEAHNQVGVEDPDFMVRSQSEINEMATSVSKTMTMLLAAIAGVSLVVGGIGIMNIMLVSVTERTREIGIRLSIGAKSRDVMVQFLSEALTLSLGGGIIGIGLAVSIIYACNHFFHLPAAIETKPVIISFLFSGMVGVFFGWYPARKAARLDPIEALRYQ